MDITDLRTQVEKGVDSLDEKNFPVLCRWRKANRDWLVENILHVAEKEGMDSIGMTLACYESDLETDKDLK